jgi:hypothetical protein
MKSKILNFLLIISSLFGYLEWSGTSHAFLFEAEITLLSKLFSAPTSVIHPFTLLPLVGQIILCITLFQKHPGKILTYLGMMCLGVLLVFILAIGIMSLNVKIICSTLPFIVISVSTIIHQRKNKR